MRLDLATISGNALNLEQYQDLQFREHSSDELIDVET